MSTTIHNRAARRRLLAGKAKGPNRCARPGPLLQTTLKSINIGPREASDADRAWFAANPNRHFHIRSPFPRELAALGAIGPAGADEVAARSLVAVWQERPGMRHRWPCAIDGLAGRHAQLDCDEVGLLLVRARLDGKQSADDRVRLVAIALPELSEAEVRAVLRVSS